MPLLVERFKNSEDRRLVFDDVYFTTFSMEGSVNTEKWKLGYIPMHFYPELEEQIHEIFL